ncbi:MAG TPA: hypothetical protein GXX41_13080 [Thermoanaerobacterium sp.]|nr:hypothetical protein [Thermoanaerobacterium sp.]
MIRNPFEFVRQHWFAKLVDALRHGKSVLISGDECSGKTILARLLAESAYLLDRTAVVQSVNDIDPCLIPPSWHNFELSQDCGLLALVKEIKNYGPGRIVVDEVRLDESKVLYGELLRMPGIFVIGQYPVLAWWKEFLQSLPERDAVASFGFIVELSRGSRDPTQYKPGFKADIYAVSPVDAGIPSLAPIFPESLKDMPHKLDDCRCLTHSDP